MSDRVRKDGSRFGYRLIRPGGRVRWCGRWFRLDDAPARITVAQHAALPFGDHARRENTPKYDGRLDGMVGLFYDYSPGHSIDAIHLHSIGDEWPGPHCVNDVFCWDQWPAEQIGPGR